jgi:hypothetical protein
MVDKNPKQILITKTQMFKTSQQLKQKKI